MRPGSASDDGGPSLGKDYVTVTAEQLRAACVPLFEGMGTPRDEAEVVVDVHVGQVLRGEESHGVRNANFYTSAN